jgi:hypothetical protein
MRALRMMKFDETQVEPTAILLSLLKGFCYGSSLFAENN